MSILETIRTALRALLSNKMRSVLTMLGVVIGVSAVVAMLALGEGTKADIETNIRSLGADVLTVRNGPAQRGAVRAQSVDTLKLEDAEALAAVDNVIAVAPASNGSAQIKRLAGNIGAQVVGVTPAYFQVQKLSIEEGQAITESQVRGRLHTCVLGANVYNTLFPLGNAIGEHVKIKGLSFQVVGVLVSKGSGFSSSDDNVLVPITTHMNTLFGRQFVSSITVQVASEDLIDQAKTDVEAFLRMRHRLKPGDDSDFNISSTKDVLETVGQITGVMTAFLAALAAISLVVGGIGIMNIMLVSVRERTREIGVRMAVGARRRDILLQFLIEAVTVSVLGGVIGLAIGAGGAYGMSKAVGTGFSLPVYAVVLSLVVSLATGVCFGVWPARSASKLDPVEALRYE